MPKFGKVFFGIKVNITVIVEDENERVEQSASHLLILPLMPVIITRRDSSDSASTPWHYIGIKPNIG